MVNQSETRTEKGMSLSRGPALVLGTVLLAAGLYFLYRQHTFPQFSNFPDGSAPVHGNVLFGIFGANGWTGMLTAVAGGLLLFGAAQHLLAKTMSLIVGVALGAAAIIALVSDNVLGMAAANGWTELGWGASAAILLFNTVVPRRRRTVVADGPVSDRAVAERDTAHVRRREVGAAGAGTAAGVGGAAAVEPRGTPAREERAAAERPGAGRDSATAGVPAGREDQTVAGGATGNQDRTVADGGAGSEDRTVAHDQVGSEERTVAHDQVGSGDRTVAQDGGAREPATARSDAPARGGGWLDRLKGGRGR